MAAMATTVRPWTGGRPLRDAYGDFIWRRPGLFRRELILEAGSEQLARLTWDKWYSFDATADSADGRWLMRRRRSISLGRGCIVEEVKTGTEVATFRRNWRGTGEVRFASGVQYAWKSEGFWRTTHFWLDASGTRLVVMRPLLGFGGRTYEMRVEPAARTLAELPVLVLLGGYVMALRSSQKDRKSVV